VLRPVLRDGLDLSSNPAITSGRIGGVLLITCGLFTFITVLLPKPPGFQVAGVVHIAIGSIISGIIVGRVPWDRLPHSARLALAPAAMVLIAFHNVFGGVDPFRYGMFFFVVFVWLGLCEPRWYSLRMAPFVLIAYLVPLLLRDASASDLASVSYAVPLYVTVGEVLAWRTSRLRELHDTLQATAEHDPLTGLPNRAVFNAALERACDAGAEVAVIFVDLDGFKQINDRLGHQAGDDVLIRVADVLRHCVRLDRGDLPCRFAGDEFVVLIRDRDAARIAPRVADRLVALVRQVHSGDGRSVRVSVGVASGTAPTPREVVDAADEAMYEAKRAGGTDVITVELSSATGA